MATFDEMKESRERRQRAEQELRDKLLALRSDEQLMLQYTLSSGTRCVITGFFEDRLQITCAGGNQWSEQAGRGALTLGMLSVEELRELLEIRVVIEEWKAGNLAELPVPKKPFDDWRCPHGFEIPILAGES